MAKDLHSFLSDYSKAFPTDVIRVSKPISVRWECSEIARKFERQNKFPLIVFEKLITTEGTLSDFPCVINVLGDRRKLAFAIGSTFENVAIDWRKRCDNPIPPVLVKRKEAPVKEKVLKGDEVNLLALPTLHHHEMDPGPYITAGMLTTKDLEQGAYNTSFQRGFIAGPREIRCYISPRTHNFYNLKAFHAQGREMPVIYWVGHHPSVLMGAHTRASYMEDHYHMAGAVSGEPLRLVSSETLGDDFLVPADAEFVIEGIMRPNAFRPEGPFGEYPRYYGPQRHSPVFEVTAVTCRKEPLWHSFMVGINNNYGGTQEEGTIYAAVKRVVPQVQRVYVPVSGSGRFHAYIQLKKTHDGQPKEAIMAALSASEWVKHVVVVDDDIDIYDDRWVLWAIATRSQWDRDLVVVPGCHGSQLDPTSKPGGISTKAGIDATKPAPPKRFPFRLSVPKEVEEKIKLEDFIDAETLSRVPGASDK